MNENLDQNSHMSLLLDEAPFVVFDIETTGGAPQKNGITEIFAIRYKNGHIEDLFHSLVNPRIFIPPIVRKITGLNNRMLRNEPTIESVMPEFMLFIQDDILVSHNIVGDLKFLKYFSLQVTGEEIDNTFLCTHLLVEKLFKNAPQKSLTGLGQFFNLEKHEMHRAEGDAYVTLELFKILITELKRRNIKTIADAIRLQGDYESSVSLGWKISSKSIAKIPHNPGVLFFYNAANDVIFFTSAIDMKQEFTKLSDFTQIPRPLMRILINATDVSATTSQDMFSAMLMEAHAFKKYDIQFKPENWHHRAYLALLLHENKTKTGFETDYIQQNVDYAFGPINNKTLTLDTLKDISKCLGYSMSKKMTHLNCTQAYALRHFLLNDIEDELLLLKAKQKSLFNIFSKKRLKLIKDRLKALTSISRIKNNLRYTNVLNTSGLLIIRTSDHKFLLRPVNQGIARTEPLVRIQNLEHYINIHKDKIIRSIRKFIPYRLSSNGLSAVDAALVNATLSWIYSSSCKAEGAFIKLDDLLNNPDRVRSQILRANQAPKISVS